MALSRGGLKVGTRLRLVVVKITPGGYVQAVAISRDLALQEVFCYCRQLVRLR